MMSVRSRLGQLHVCPDIRERKSHSQWPVSRKRIYVSMSILGCDWCEAESGIHNAAGKACACVLGCRNEDGEVVVTYRDSELDSQR